VTASRAAAGVATVAILALLPLVLGRYTISVLTEVYIFAVAALSLNLLLGYTGLVSMGHAAFFGGGAYVAAKIAREVTPLFWVVVPAALAAAGLLAAVIGYLALRTRGVTFLMLTLAFAQMLYALTFRWKDVTGGSDGYSGVPRPAGLGFTVDTTAFYWLALLVLVLVYLFMYRLVRSPFGYSLIGIRENEDRLRALGLPVTRYKLAAFVLSGVLAGLAGALFAYYNGFVSPHEVHWMLSADLLVMIVIGGVRSLIGPVLGSFVLVWLESVVSSYTDRWQTVMGVLFIVFVLAARGGLVGIASAVAQRWRQRAGMPTTAAGD